MPLSRPRRCPSRKKRISKKKKKINRRRELVKRSAAEAEQSKVAIRNIRREAIEEVKRLQKEGLSEDIVKDSEKEIQDVTDRYITAVDKLLAAKDKDVMSI